MLILAVEIAMVETTLGWKRIR